MTVTVTVHYHFLPPDSLAPPWPQGKAGIPAITLNRDASARLDDDERTLVSIEGASNSLPVNAVNESGLYSLILGSRKASARHPQS